MTITLKSGGDPSPCTCNKKQQTSPKSPPLETKLQGEPAMFTSHPYMVLEQNKSLHLTLAHGISYYLGYNQIVSMFCSASKKIST